MKYTIAHLDCQHEIISALWIRTQNLLDNEENIEDLISKLEVVIVEFNDIEAGSFMNNPIYFDFTLSYSDDEIRIAEERTRPDLIVVTLNESAVKKYALITEEGTAAAETCLCSKHMTDDCKVIAVKQADKDVKNFGFTDVSDNEVCECIIC